MKAQLVKQLPVANALGEGVLWDASTQRFWWCDILENKLFCYSPANEQISSWETPEQLCSFALVEGKSETTLLAAFSKGLAYYMPESQDVQWLQMVEEGNPGTRLNDGRTDPYGRFWVGGVVENTDLSTGESHLYQFCGGHEIHTRLSGITISNSLCWSPDGDFLFHTDTPSQVIKRFPVERDGRLGTPVAFARTEQGCMPDGSITDASSRLYNAEWGGNKVRVYTPNGDVDFDLQLPVSQVTCAAFGGDCLSLLAVTTAAVGVNEAGAGDVFIFKTNRIGIPQPRFKPINPKD